MLILGAMVLAIVMRASITARFKGIDEHRYSEVARNLIGSGNWLLLTYQGKPYDEKPPLVFWMMASTASLSGQMDQTWPYRLPGALAAAAIVCMTYLMGRRQWSRQAGVLAALALMLMPMFARQAVLARLDMVYTAWMMIAIMLWHEGLLAGRMSWVARAAFWLALAAAFLSRNALAPAFLIACILLHAWCRRDIASWRLVAPLPGLIFFSLVASGWFWAQHTYYPQDVIDNQLNEQFLERISFDAQHAKPPWYYLLNIPTEGAAACGVVLYIALFQSWINRRKGGLAEYPLWMWLWLGLVFLVMSVVPAKRPEYLLPIYPTLALVCGGWLSHRLAVLPLAPLARYLVSTGFLAACLVLLYLGFRPDAAPAATDPDEADAVIAHMPQLLMAVGLLFLIPAAFSIRARRTIELIFCVMLSILAVYGVCFNAVRPFQ